MGLGHVQPGLPIGPQRPDAEFGDQHADHGLEGDKASRKVKFVKINTSAGNGIGLKVY
jgi:hypothetical protein